MTVYGKAIDAETKQPLPGATVTLKTGNISLVATAASSEGIFYINTAQSPDVLSITSVGYSPKVWQLPDSLPQTVFELQRDYKQEPNVTVISKRKGLPWFVWAGVIALFIKENKLR